MHLKLECRRYVDESKETENRCFATSSRCRKAISSRRYFHSFALLVAIMYSMKNMYEGIYGNEAMKHLEPVVIELGTRKNEYTGEEILPNEAPYGRQEEHKRQEDDNRRPHAVIHVGPHKTGSSSLQTAIVQYKQNGILSADNYMTPFVPNVPQFNDPNDAKNNAWIAWCVFRKDKAPCGDPILKNNTRYHFESFLQNASLHKSNIIVSSEELDMPQIDIVNLKETLTSKYGFQVHIVIVYRRLYDWLHSHHNENAKYNKNFNLPFVQWLSEDMMIEDMSLHAGKVHERYSSIPEFNVSIINMHDIKKNKTQLSTFFCDHVNDASAACVESSQVVSEKQVNPSQDLDMEFIVRAVVQRYPKLDIKSEPISNGIQQQYENMVRDDTIPTMCLPKSISQKLLDLSIEIEMSLTPKEYHNSERGVKALKSDFEGKVASKLCSIDVESILDSPSWQALLRNLSLMYSSPPES